MFVFNKETGGVYIDVRVSSSSLLLISSEIMGGCTVGNGFVEITVRAHRSSIFFFSSGTGGVGKTFSPCDDEEGSTEWEVKFKKKKREKIVAPDFFFHQDEPFQFVLLPRWQNLLPRVCVKQKKKNVEQRAVVFQLG